MVVLLHHGKKTKQLTARTVSVKVVTRLEVRVTCTLAIATGVNTVCWVPVMTLYALKNGKIALYTFVSQPWLYKTQP